MKDYGPDILTVADDDGNEQEFEVIDSIEYGEDNKRYLAVIPVFENEQDYLNDSGDFIVLRMVEDGDGFSLLTVDDDEELDIIGAVFEERISQFYYDDFPDSVGDDNFERNCGSGDSSVGHFLS